MATQSAKSPFSASSAWHRPALYWLLLVVALIVVAFAVVAITDIVRDSDVAPVSVTLSGADSGREITVAQEGSVIIRLDSNPTTGYSWAVDSLDEALVTLTQDTYEGPVNGAVGQGGIQELQFTAAGAGTSELALKYWRPWEGDASVVERFTITVAVEE